MTQREVGKSICHRNGEIVTAIVVWLVLGAIVNVAVAWGLATWGTQAPGVQMVPASNYQWPREVPSSWPAPLQRGGETALGVRATISSSTEDAGQAFTYWQSLFAYGLPCRSMELELSYTADVSGKPTFYHKAILEMPKFLQNPTRIHPFLPLRFLWPGFAMNTVFYAAILWLLVAVPGRIRHWRRVRRGLCLRCGYPVGSSEVCSECGERVRVNQSTA